ncbi:HAD-IC family P-type ATPase [Leucobacter insecticola]|uniref:HAD-IC family P-type ATPase n=1 Tax=Leucobacter insecticola TaxID=2714934 RepID=UPI001980CF50|nr:HAD-IC family P-type ATPase [Leucobacter insecticola]
MFTRVNLIYATLLVLVLSTGYFLDGMFGLLIIVNSAVGMVQEIRAKRTLDRLALLNHAPIRVERADGVHEVRSEDVVLDDIVVIAAGDQIPVDGTLIDATALEIDESLLTGEADPVLPEPGNAVLSGSFVVAGSGRILATAVGPDSYAERLAAEASTFKKPSSQLRAGIDKILKYITWILVPVGLATIWNQLAGGQEWRDALRGLVAALVPMVPEGLVLMTSVAMAVGVIRLGRRNCLVQDLPAIEQLARVDVFCTDKTGTLTEDGMRVSRIEVADSTDRSPDDPDVFAVLATIGHAEGKLTGSMAAVLEHVRSQQPLATTRLIAFSSARKWAAVQLEAPRAGGISWVFGAPDVILPADCELHARAESLSTEGHRVLALASSAQPVAESGLPEALVPVALVVLDQRLRADVPDAIRYFRDQQVELKVISGDNAAAVGAISEQAGIPDGRVAVDARSLDPEAPEFAREIAAHTAFGRVTPTQKRAMVHALQGDDRIVGMTGDGVNDVFALKDADVGVAMGSGSPAARAVSRIVLLDNSFATLPHVVAEGRRVIGNIERVATLFLTKTFYSALLAFLVVVTAIPYPFLPRHVTLIGVFTIGIPAFFLALAPNTARAQDGFVRRVLGQAVPGGLGAAFAAYGAYLAARSVFGVEEATRVMNSSTALLALIAVAFFVLIAVARPFAWWKVALVAAMMGCVLAVLVTPLGRTVFDIDLRDWRAVALALGFGAGGILLRTLAGLLLRGRWRRRLSDVRRPAT